MSDTAENVSTTASEDAVVAAKWRPLVLAVIFLAMILRLLAAFALERHVNQAGRPFFVEGDANGYWELGLALARGNEYAVHAPPRRVLRVPSFPLLLAASIRLFGESVFAARCVLAVVGTVCCWLTYLLGSRLVMRRVGFSAALMMAVHPWQIGNSVLILSENWFTFWMLLSLLALSCLLDEQPTSRTDASVLRRQTLLCALGTGALTAAAVLVRPGFLPWLVVSAVAVLFFRRRYLTSGLVLAGTLLVGFVLVILPWVIRNQAVTGQVVVTSLWGGPSLYDGLNPDADGSSNMEFFGRDNVMATLSEYEMNAHYQQLALDFAVNHPSRVVELAGRKLQRFLQPMPNTVAVGWGLWGGCVVAAVVFAGLAVVGLRSRMLNASGLFLVLGPFLLSLVVHMVFVGSLRYRLPGEFPLSILAATGFFQCLLGRKPVQIPSQAQLSRRH